MESNTPDQKPKTMEDVLKEVAGYKKENGNYNLRHHTLFTYKQIIAAMREWESISNKERDAKIEYLTIENMGLQQEAKEYFEIIKELVELKSMKDSVGKNETYLLRQPLAWKAAFEVIENKL